MLVCLCEDQRLDFVVVTYEMSMRGKLTGCWDMVLIGGCGSREKREKLKKALGLPENLGPGAFLDCLNAVISPEELCSMIKKETES